jgi:hypothetical protein
VIEMHSDSSKLIPWFAVTLWLFAGSLSAGSPVLDQALEKYYAGYPREAVGMLEPLAVAGDVDAQYLLGNLLYTLTQSGQFEVAGDPVKWYRLAALQGAARAAYALGAIYNNRWLQSRRDEDLGLAESWYRQAQGLGDDRARTALDKLATHKKTRGKAPSLTYSNESFGNKRQSPPAAQAAPPAAAKQAQQTATLADVLAGLQAVEDPEVDTQKLKALLNQLEGTEQADTSGAAMATLKQMLGSFESTDELFADLLKLIGHLEAASELSTAPGAN